MHSNTESRNAQFKIETSSSASSATIENTKVDGIKPILKNKGETEKCNIHLTSILKHKDNQENDNFQTGRASILKRFFDDHHSHFSNSETLWSGQNGQELPHPILKHKTLSDKEINKEESLPKSILKKKSSLDEAKPKLEKVKPILKKNKSSEDFKSEPPQAKPILRNLRRNSEANVNSHTQL
jgi:hypothetical protein